MTASALCRWHRAWISGASIACLGVGSLLNSGCTPLGSELSSSSQAKQQQTARLNSDASRQKVAQTSHSKTSQKSSPKVAKKTPTKPGAQVARSAPGRVRISDLDTPPAPEIASTVRPPASAAANGAARINSTPLAAKSKAPQNDLAAVYADATRPAQGSQNVKTVAGTKPTASRPATAKSAAKRSAADLSNDTLPDDVALAETKPGARSSSKSADKRPVIRPVVKPAAQQDAASKSESIARNDAGARLDPNRRIAGTAYDRQRANLLMERAYGMYRSGYPEEALRLASVAAELEKSRQAVYRRGEERPSDFITWLQSADGGRSASPPMIRPQGLDAQQTAELLPKPPESGIATASLATRSRKPFGEIQRAEGGATVPVQDPFASLNATTRTNSGIDLLPPERQKLTGNDAANLRASANSPQIAGSPAAPAAAPVAPAVAESSKADSVALNAAAPPADAAVSKSESNAAASPAPAAPKPLVGKSDALPVPDDRSDSGSEAFSDAEPPALLPAHTTQLTLVGILGLVTGVAGMAGLRWWQIQERRHYSGK